MARTYRSRFLAVLVEVERRMATEYEGLATAVAGEVARRALPDGTVPRTATPDILQAASARVLAFFVGPGRERAPFVVANGRMVPLSPYARALWAGITDGVRVAVEHQATLLERSLPPVVAARMRRATGNPFVAARAQVREQVFRPNRLATYDAPHSWVDPNGYRLSDRIWNASGETRRRLDAYLEQAIREGRGAQEMARELEQFLVPGRRLQRTNTPYGVDASFDGMRLARTEIARAHGRATEAAAAMNPFIDGLKWNLSGSHAKRDICDDNAHGGPNGNGIYPKDGPLPQMPAHANCLCHWSYETVPARERERILDHLEADMRRARAELVDLIGPLLVQEFTDLLLRDWEQATAEAQTLARLGVLV